ITAVQPEGRYGKMEISYDGQIIDFIEKPKGDGVWINGGFMVAEPQIFNYIDNDMSILETEVMEKLIRAKELFAYKHKGSWKCMDTLRDKIILNQIWNTKNPFWKMW
ncbi:MAG TPA: sugar phosphate nucleotidyltransferase, partial [Victivallales bacterium]|nr:sugar phosphate nucleotidyltransferase [Victivallales bacterium]